MLEKDTKFLANDKPARKADLKTGVRVVIDAQMDTKMKMYVAESITLGAATGSTAAAKAGTPAKPAATTTSKTPTTK